MNHWTMRLAAMGLVSLPAAALAEEQPGALLGTAVSSTTLSGYVNTSAHWNPGNGNGEVPRYLFNKSSKQDGFNLNVVDLTLERPLDESIWAAGYKVQMWFGPDAASYGTTMDSFGVDFSAAAIRQAHVNLRCPIGNGLDFKVGVFDGLLGYESPDAGSNPNYTRAYGLALTAVSQTGIQASYPITEHISLGAAVANTVSPIIDSKAHQPFEPNAPKAESFKSYSGLIALTAPDDWGFLAGSTLFAGALNGYNNNSDWDQTTWYLGLTCHTPLPGLRAGASYAYLGTTDFNAGNDDYANALALYASFQATERLSFHGRAEYAWSSTSVFGQFTPIEGGNNEIFALTGTVQYDLWQNVISRLEVRWDHLAGDGEMTRYGGEPSGVGGGNGVPPPNIGDRNHVLFAVNLIYQF